MVEILFIWAPRTHAYRIGSLNPSWSKNSCTNSRTLDLELLIIMKFTWSLVLQYTYLSLPGQSGGSDNQGSTAVSASDDGSGSHQQVSLMVIYFGETNGFCFVDIPKMKIEEKKNCLPAAVYL